MYTLPKTYSSHLKMDGWNTYTVVSFWSKKSIFRCFLLSVSRRVYWPQNQTFLEQLALIGEVYGHCNALSYERRLDDLSDSCQCYYVDVNCRIFPLFFTHFCGFPEKTGVKICPNYLTQRQLTELPEHLFGFARRCYFLDAFEDFLQVGIHWGNPMGLLWKTHNGWL